MSDRSIVQVTLWNSPYLGNFMSSQIALARAVRERFGLATHFVLGPGGERQPWLSELEGDGMTWSALAPGRRAWRSQLDQVIAERSAALVHSHFTAADPAAANASHAAGVPCVWHVHTGFNGYPLITRAKDLVKMRLIARRRVARIIVVSPWLAEFVERRGAPREKVEVVPNAIVFERFEQLPDRAAARARFGLDGDAQVVLGLGWWPEVKGVDVLVDAIAALAERRQAPALLLVGEEQMRTFLEQRYPRQPRWLHTEGFVGDVETLYAAADVFVSASRHEGQSTAIGEAAACGLPVVMSDIAGTSGWAAAPAISTFASESPEALADELVGLLANTPQQLAERGAANREWAREQMGIDAWCAQICATYRSLL